MKLGFIGLGKMGMQLTTRLLAGGHDVIAMDVVPASLNQAIALGATAAYSRGQVLELFGGEPAVIWIMIPANLVQTEIEAWTELLPAGSIIIDGGNSDYRETIKRGAAAREHGIELVDAGTSGGILGLADGFSMMIGGSDAAVAAAAPLFASLAQPGGWGHFGTTGSGHYIKMVHNGVEYGLMEAYAEGFHLLKDGPVAGLDLGRIAGVWQHGSIINSGLNGLAAEILVANPELTGLDGYVAANGEADWTLQTAATSLIELPVIQAAVDVRTASQTGTVHFGTKLLAALRGAFGGHAVNK